MCFTEQQSYLNAISLVLVGMFKSKKAPLLSAALVFLACKDLIQALTYRALRKGKDTRALTQLSWIHICFQPLFCNVFLRHFDPAYQHWNKIMCACVAVGLYSLTVLHAFDIQSDPPCTKRDSKDDFCSDRTESYQGKYHVGYKFRLDNTNELRRHLYQCLLLAPFLTRAWKLNAAWVGGVIVLYALMQAKSVGSGEIAAMWCFLSIIFAIPVALFDDHFMPPPRMTCPPKRKTFM